MAGIEQTAQAIYDIAQRNAAAHRAIGVHPYGVMLASYDAILAHITVCADLEAQYRCRMDPAALWGQDEQQLRATALHKCRVLAGKRSKKILVERYGERIAAEIIGR